MPSIVVALMARARRLVEAGQLDEALTVIRDAVRRAPGAVDAEVMLAWVLLRRGEDETALALLEQVRARVPAGRTAPIDAALASTYDVLGRADDAIKACRAALAGEPLRVDAAILLAELLADRGAFEEAGVLYRGVLDRVRPEMKSMVEARLAELKDPK